LGGKRSLTEIWHPRHGSVAHQLAEQPSTFDFFQAVLLIEQLAKKCNDSSVEDHDRALPEALIGVFNHGREEAVRITSPATSAFPTSQIDSLELDPFGQPRMTVNFMGLTGPSGILPRVYTDTLARVNRDGRGGERYALRDFLDQFNHRLISLFFSAWTKYRFPIRILRSENKDTLLEVGIASTAGLVHQKTGDKGAISRDRLLGFAGLLTQHPSTAGNLEAVLKRLLGVPIRVLQFQPSVLDLDAESQCCLGIDNGCGELGISAVVGPRTRTRQHKIRIEIGPLDYDQFKNFLPGDDRCGGFGQVDQVVRTFAGQAIEYDLRLQVRSERVPGCRLETFASTADQDVGLCSRLGFDSWLESDQWPEVLDDAIVSD
jgi:type VI secretion system protein ImpH